MWFKNNVDPIKEEAARKKQVLLDAAISDERQNLSKEEQIKLLPVTSIGYDCISNALEVTIDPVMFNEMNIEKYIEKIRSIIGDEIDLTIAPQNYPIKNSCLNRKASCTPLQGGVEIGEAGCTMGFKATYNGHVGFVTAGHCFDQIGESVTQPKNGVEIGTVITNFNAQEAGCDCAFVDASIYVANGGIFGITDPTTTGLSWYGKSVVMSGKNSGVKYGAVVASNRTGYFGAEGTVYNMVVADYASQGGDSGAPIRSLYVNESSEEFELLGFHEGRIEGEAYYTRQGMYSIWFTGLTWGF